MPKLNDCAAEIYKKVNFLAQIEWTFTYCVFQGTLEDSENAVSILGKEDCGEFKTRSAELSGSQETTISWYRDEGNIKFRVLDVTKPI